MESSRRGVPETFRWGNSWVTVLLTGDGGGRRLRGEHRGAGSCHRGGGRWGPRASRSGGVGGAGVASRRGGECRALGGRPVGRSAATDVGQGDPWVCGAAAQGAGARGDRDDAPGLPAGVADRRGRRPTVRAVGPTGAGAADTGGTRAGRPCDRRGIGAVAGPGVGGARGLESGADRSRSTRGAASRRPGGAAGRGAASGPLSRGAARGAGAGGRGALAGAALGPAGRSAVPGGPSGGSAAHPASGPHGAGDRAWRGPRARPGRLGGGDPLPGPVSGGRRGAARAQRHLPVPGPGALRRRRRRRLLRARCGRGGLPAPVGGRRGVGGRRAVGQRQVVAGPGRCRRRARTRRSPGGGRHPRGPPRRRPHGPPSVRAGPGAGGRPVRGGRRSVRRHRRASPAVHGPGRARRAGPAGGRAAGRPVG